MGLRQTHLPVGLKVKWGDSVLDVKCQDVTPASQLHYIARNILGDAVVEVIMAAAAGPKVGIS